MHHGDIRLTMEAYDEQLRDLRCSDHQASCVQHLTPAPTFENR